jgi:hypothetical protein
MSWQLLQQQYQGVVSHWERQQWAAEEQRRVQGEYRAWATTQLQRTLSELSRSLTARSTAQLGAQGFDYQVSEARWLSLAPEAPPLMTTAVQRGSCCVYIYGQIWDGQPPSLFFLRSGQHAGRLAGLLCSPAAWLAGGPHEPASLRAPDAAGARLTIDALAFRAVTLLLEQLSREGIKSIAA